MLEEVNLYDNSEEPQTVLISKELTRAIRTVVIDTLRNNKDVFAWNYDEMLRLDPLLVTHKLGVEPIQKPIKQSARVFRPEVELQVKAEIEKLLQARFI